MNSGITPIVRNLIVINVIFFLATQVMDDLMTKTFAGFFFKSPHFMPWQIISHMFMHASFTHILFNMLGLWVFGTHLERLWGPKRFLTYYFFCGIGAYLLHFGIGYYELSQLLKGMTNEQIRTVYTAFGDESTVTREMQLAMQIVHIPVVGASGAVFGLLLGFAILFPNTLLYVYFAFPIKAKYFALIYGVIEFFSALQNRAGDSVAHFAHLGGMLFGYILLKIWQRRRDSFY